MRGQVAEKDNSERYLITYADLMNLLLILFIVLYVTATKDVTKGYAVINAIAAGFNGTSSVASATLSSGSNIKNSKPAKGAGAVKATDYNDFFDQLLALLKQRGLLDKVDVTDSNSEVTITLKDTVLFKPGRADLDQNSVSLLNSIGGLMDKISFGGLLIEGHTDSDPIHTTQFRDNRELSQMRAYNVANVIEAAGINPQKVLTLGCGEYHPVAPNDTPANKAKNRRVVLVIMKNGVQYSNGDIGSVDLLREYNALTNPTKLSSSKASTASKGKTPSKTSKASPKGKTTSSPKK